MTPAEANQARRAAAIKRSRRIDQLPEAQYLSALHRIAAIEPSVMDRVLDELEAFHKRLHPLRFKRSGTGITAYCDICPDWRVHLEDDHSLEDLHKLAEQHSGIEWP